MNNRVMIVAFVVLLLLMLVAYLILKNSGFLANKLSKALPSPTPTPTLTTLTPTPQITGTVGQQTDLVNTLNSTNSISLFTKALKDTKLIDVLSMGDPYTVFALENNAMQNILDSTNGNMDALNEKLKMQIVYGTLNSDQIKAPLTSLTGQMISLGNAKIDDTINANNGVVYIVNVPVSVQ